MDGRGAEDAAPTLDPWSYLQWVRSLQRKMLAGGDLPKLAADLVHAYAETTEHIAMRPVDWHLYLSLATRRAMQEEGGTADALREVIELHEQSTHDSLDMSLYVRYASLLLLLYTAQTNTALALDELAHDVSGTEGGRLDVSALVQKWTGVEDTPPLRPNGMYADGATLRPLLPAADADDAQETLDDLLSEDAVRTALRTAYARCAWHPTESAAVWEPYLHWELSLLEADKSAERLELLKQIYVARLQVPHPALERVFQEFSGFVSTHYPPEEYEETLASANKVYAGALKLWEAHERHESAVAHGAMEQWTAYLGWESHRVKTMRTAKDKSHLATEEEFGAVLYRRALHRFGWYPLGKNDKEAAHYAKPPTPAEEKAWKTKQGRKSHKMLEKEQAQARADARALCAAPESMWLDSIALVNTQKAEATALLSMCHDAVRTLPASGRLWALYLRTLVRFQKPRGQFEEVYQDALASGTIATVGGSAALVPFLQARVDGERAYATLDAAAAERIPPEEVVLHADLDRFMALYEVLAHALGEMAKLPKGEYDASFTLERYMVDWIERGARSVSATAGPEAAAGLYPLAEDVWENALKQQASSVQGHLEAALYFARHDNDARARQLFRAGAGRHTDENKMPLIEEWVRFEHARGSMSEIEHTESKAKMETDRMWKAWYRSMQQAAEGKASEEKSVTQGAGPVEDKASEAPAVWPSEAQSMTEHAVAAQAPAAQAPAAQAPPPAPVAAPASDDVPMPDAPESFKRKADDVDAPGPSDQKKGRTEAPAPPRDREFSSVLVEGLPADAAESEVRAFFRECGTIYEVLGPRAVDAPSPDGEPTSAALVEFTDRDMVAAARTRDLKRVRGFEVHISLSYLCTLYVTNFAPETDDEMIRTRFGKYGAIFDVRWPSRKFVQSRRFCYVQFVRPEYAQAALSEHGAQWHEEFALQVFLSNPSHKKQRSDANANERELYMTGLPRTVAQDEVQAFFEAHAPVESVRVPLRPDGKSRGIAFITFHSEIDARRAMQATNSTKFKGRLVAVTLADAGRRGHSEQKEESKDDRFARSVQVRGLPLDAQEALIQQALEKELGPGSVRRVFWTPERHSDSSLVELADAETAGRAVLAAAAAYGEHPLTITPHTPAPPTETFAPRAARGRRGRGGALGFARVHSTPRAPPSNAQGQDKFRAMLYEK